VEYELWIVAMTKNFEVSVLMTKKRRKEDRKNGVEKWGGKLKNAVMLLIN